jgi:hypothetical protein
MVSVAQNLERIHERIDAALKRAGRRDEVTLVAVTKTITADKIAEAYRCGVRYFGENRVQEFKEKRLALPSARWHLVGHLQTNKARLAVELFDRVDSVDSVRLAEKLAHAVGGQGSKLPVLIQVHLGEEPSKHGVAPGEVEALLQQVAKLETLQVEGLMTIPPFSDNPEETRPYFRQLRTLAERLERSRIPGVSMRELSMGMTNDFEVAIEEGATQVRLGTAIFGPRPAPREPKP